MVQISELKVIENIFFRNEFKYNKVSLYPFIAKNFSEEKALDVETINKITNLINEASKDNHAHNALLKKDITKIKEKIYKKHLEFDSDKWIKLLVQIKQKITFHLGLEFELRDIRFVDNFPEVYKNLQDRGASAITILEGQENPGIYYLNKRVDLSSTAIHIIHEQIHTCLSQNKDKDQFFIEWFEEGLAVLYSLLIYYELTEDMETLNTYKNRSFIFNKVKPEWDFAKRYFEYMKIMSRIFVNDGFEQLNLLIKKYFEKDGDYIKSFLTKIQNNELAVGYLPKNEIENFIANYAIIVEPEQITPLEFLIVETLNKPKTIPELINELSAPENIINGALGRLFGKGICLMVKDNKIDINWRKKDLFQSGLIKPLLPFG